MWRVAIGQKQYGPYSLEKLRELYAEGRVPADARIWHPQQQTWLAAQDVPELQDEENEVVLVEDACGDFSGTRSSAGRAPDTWGDYLAFRRMITPIIIQVVFWIGAVLASMAGIFMMIAGIAANEVGAILTGFFAMLLGPIAVRIYCELLIVLFRMNETLTEIRHELKRRA